ncbi:MAG: hypothetical protein HOP03_00040 [Lysobacter sp.]|nr:hypothetical protein [Lysobacter sp.]
MRDGLLEIIVRFSEGDDALEMPITLIVGGLLVTGHIISKKKYVEQNTLTAHIKKLMESIPEEDNTPEPEDDGKREYIHLRDARYLSPGQGPLPSTGSIQCRIKLSDVSGFNFGNFSSSAEG